MNFAVGAFNLLLNMYKNRKIRAGIGLNNDNERNICDKSAPALQVIAEDEIIEEPLLKVSS